MQKIKMSIKRRIKRCTKWVYKIIYRVAISVGTIKIFVLTSIYLFYNSPWTLLTTFQLILYWMSPVVEIITTWSGFDFCELLHINQRESWWKSGVIKVGNRIFYLTIHLKHYIYIVHRAVWKEIWHHIWDKYDWTNCITMAVDIEHLWIQKKVNIVFKNQA